MRLLPDGFDSVDELYADDQLGQLVVSVEAAPTVLCRLGEFEDHGERRLVGEASLGSHGTVPEAQTTASKRIPGYEGAATRLRAGRVDDIAASGDNGFAVIRRDRAREAAFEKALREAAKRYGYEDHELLRYDHALPRELREADIVFPPVGDEDDAAGGAGIGFVSQAVPQLRAEGWRVEIDGTWPFRLQTSTMARTLALVARRACIEHSDPKNRRT